MFIQMLSALVGNNNKEEQKHYSLTAGREKGKCTENLKGSARVSRRYDFCGIQNKNRNMKGKKVNQRKLSSGARTLDDQKSDCT
ncbi:hypothetical protein AVEN_22747-1 [Araneus ventricosus]|uniref:Uncharacterized protein n=1 Tax=Araneus ventricosus TaxID=182803 RepID=A0A4Y2VR65_ARAVE|nr:hypothetical protein AVEN_22747-1 [Araneus ventricosus]